MDVLLKSLLREQVGLWQAFYPPRTYRGSAKLMGGCLISSGSGVLMWVRRDPHGDDEGVYSIPSPARSRRQCILHHDRLVAPAPGPGSQERG